MLALSVVQVLVGCASTAPVPMPSEAAATVAIRRAATGGVSVEGRPIRYMVWNDDDERRRTVMLIATIHGDEPAGTPLLELLDARIAADPTLAADQRIVIVPVVSPDGLAASTRTNARGIDLNRNFPAENFAPARRRGDWPLSEPESRALHDLIMRYEPDVLVSIHQPLACVDWDGPARDLAAAMAAAGPLPARKLGTRPGSLGAWAGERLGIPTITLELPSGAERLSDEQLWSHYGPVVLEALRN